MTALPSSPSRTQRALAGVVLAALAVAALAVAPVGPAGAQSTGATPVNSCTTIDSAGQYVLTKNVTSDVSGDDEPCIEVTAGNVTLDGAGHSLTGSGAGHGVEVNGVENPVTNVTIERLHANEWTVGVFVLGVNDSTVRNVVANGTISGVSLAQSSGNRILDTTAYDNSIGVAVGGESHDNTVANAVTVENKWGIHFERESANNTVRNSVARNNSNWDYYAMRNLGTNEVSDLELSTTTLSFTEQNIAIRAVTDPPDLPAGTGNRNAFIQVFAAAGESPSLSLTMSDGSGSGTATLWRTTQGSWSRVPDASADAAAGTVSAENLTQFGVFGALSNSGDGGQVNVTTSQPPSVQRTMTTVPGVSNAGAGTASTAAPTSAATGVVTSGVSPNGTGAAAAATATAAVGSNGSASGSTNTSAAAASQPAESAPNGNDSGSVSGTAAAETGNTGGLLSSGVGWAKVLFAVAALVALALLIAVVVVRRRRRDRNRGF